MSIQNSAVIIGVGPERGLGATLAKHFAAQGLHIYIAGRSKEKLQHVADRIRENGGSISLVVADATQWCDINHLFDVIRSEHTAL